MRKHLSLLMLVVALLLPWASSAQGTAISSFPWSCNFESTADNAAWSFSNNSPNGWYIGTAVHNSGTHALYVSNNNGSSNVYTGTTACVSYAYVTLNIASAGQYALQFDWKCGGESSYDFLRVAMAPSSQTLTTTYSDWTTTAVPTGFTALDGGSKLNLQGTTWQTQTSVINFTSGGTYRIIFVWRNDPSVTNADPAAIDNVVINELTCPQPTALNAIPSTDQIDLSWTAGGSETEWMVTINDTIVDFAYTTSYSATNLEGNTPYTFKVYAICGAGDTSMATVGNFRTSCTAISNLPYSNGFEDEPYYLSGTTTYADAFPSCWTRINDATGSYNYYPYISTTASYVHSGSKGMYWYQTSSTGYAQNEYAILPPVDINVYDITDLTLSFYAKTTGTSYHPMPIVGVMTNPTDATTFTPVYTFTSTEITTDWQLFAVSLASYTGTGSYIAIKWPNPGSTSYMAIDDIFLTDEWCNFPLDVTYTSTTESITLSWNANGNTTFTVAFDGDTVTNVTDTFYTFTNLQSNTPYDYAVAGECGSTNSMFIGGTARTACAAISSLPYSNDFEDEPYYLSGTTTYAEAFPNCWTRINDATSTYNYYPYISTSSSYLIHGGKSMYWYHSTTTTYANNQYAVLPPIDPTAIDITDLTLAFYGKTTATASPYPQFITGVMTDPTDATTFVPLDTVTLTTTPTLYVVSLAGYTGTGTYIAIRSPRTSTSTAKYASLDDIYLTDEWCDAPTSVTASSTPDNVTVSWNAPNGTSFTVVLGDDTITNVSGTTYTFTGLTPNTEYNYAVAVECTSGISMFIGGSIYTQCVAIDSLPYTQTFESAPTGGSSSNTFVNCMGRLNNGTTYFGFPYVSSSASYNHTPGGSKGLYWYNSTTTGTYGDYQCVVMPGVDTDAYPINTLQLRFWARATGTSYNPVFQVGVMTDPTDINTFQLVNTINVGTNINYSEFTVPFGTYTGQGQYIAIKAVRPSTSWYATVDDITIEPMPTCPPVHNLTATTTASSVLLTWDYQDGFSAPASYEVSYDVVGSTGTPTYITANDNYATITGLVSGTSYKAVVRADCGDGDMGRADSVVFTVSASNSIDLVGSSSTEYTLPVNNYWNYSYTQQLVSAAEMGNTAATLTGIDFQYAYSSPSSAKTNVTIYLANTTTSSLSSAFIPYNSSTFQAVYSGNLNCSQGWNHFQFTTPFNYDGTSNLLIAIHDNSGDYDGNTYVFNMHSATGMARYDYNDDDPYVLTSLTSDSPTSPSYRSNMKIHFASSGAVGCVAPVVAVTNVTANSVDVVWAPGNDETDWDVDYRTTGSTTWINAATGISATNYTVTGLDDATEYEFRVSFTCSSNNVLYYATASALTACIAKTIPYTENFDTYTSSTTAATGIQVPCWDYIMTGTSSYQTGTYLPQIYYSATNANSGNYSLRLYGVGYHMLPPMGAPLDSLMMSFSRYTTSTSYGLIVGVMEGGVFLPIDTLSNVSSQHVYYEVDFHNYHGTSRTIAFQNYYTTSTSTYYSYSYLDDIMVLYRSDCPRVTHVAAHNITQTDATITWDTTAAVDYEVQYGPTGFDLGTGTSVIAYGADSLDISGLALNTPYDVYVRGICGADSGIWSFVYTFRTACGEIDSLPFTENFDAQATGSSSTGSNFIPCWVRLNNGTSYGGYPYVGGSSYNHTPGGSQGLYWCNSTTTGTYGDYQIIVLPPIDTIEYPTNTLKLTFWSRASSTSYSPVFHVGVMRDANVDTTFQQVAVINVGSSTTWQKFTTIFGNYTGSGNRIAIRALRSSSSWYAYVDDITLEVAPSCPTVESHTVTATASAARITWDYDHSFGYAPDGYEVSYGYASDNLVISTVTVNDPMVQLTGLAADTAYTVSIRPICTDGAATAHTFDFNTASLPCLEWDTTSATGGGSSPTATYTVGTPGTSTTNVMPVNGGYSYSYCNHLIRTSDINTMPTGTTYISGIDFEYAATAPMVSKTNCTIYMCHTTMTTCDNFANPADLVMVYEGPLNCTTQGWNHFEFNRGTFAYNGTSNMIVAIVDNSGATDANESFYYEAPGVSVSHRVYRNDAPYTFADLGNVTASNSMWRTNMRLTTGGSGGGDCLSQASCYAPAVFLSEDSVGDIHIEWIPGYQETSWNLDYQADGATSWTSVLTGTTATSHTIAVSTLQTNTLYTFRVTPNCTDTVISGTATHRTPCGLMTPPFTENFDGVLGSSSTTPTAGYLPSCWDIYNDGTRTNYQYCPYVYNSSTYAHSGNNCIRFYSYNSSGDSNQYLILPAIDTNLYPVDGLQLSFWLSAYSASSNYFATVVAGVMTDPTDEYSFIPYDTVSATSTSYEYFEINFNHYTGPQGRITMLFPKPMSSSQYEYGYVDDVMLGPIPTCPHVTDLTVDMVTYDSVAISWTAGGSETEWSVSSDGTTWVSCTSTSYIFSGLTPSTNYTFYVRPVCGVGDTGYSMNVSASTTCVAVSLPYSENFDGITTSTTAATGAHVDCWDYIMTGTATYQTGSYLPQVYYNATNAHSGSYSYRLYGMGYHMLPPMPTSLDSLELTFWDYTTSTSYGLEVGVMEGNTFVPIETITSPTSTHMQHTVHFATYTGTSRIIAFYNYYTSGTSTYYSYHYIDDVHVDYLPTCVAVMGVNATSISTNSITVDWTDVTPATQWQVRYGQSANSMTTITVTSHPVTVNGLDSLTTYNFEVRPICTVGDTGAWSNAVGLSTTICDNASIAMSYNPSAAATTSSYLPIGYGFYNYSYVQTILDSAQMANLGGGDVIAMTYEPTVATAGDMFNHITIFMANVPESDLSAGWILPNATHTFVRVLNDGNLCYTDAGVHYAQFDTTFSWDGHSNVLVAVKRDHGDYTSGASFRAHTASASKARYVYQDSGPYDYTNPSATGTATSTVGDIQLISCGGCSAPGVSVASHTYESAVINATGNGSTFELEYGTDPSVMPNTLTSTNGTFSIAGLSPATQYFFRVRQECDVNEWSNWSEGNFVTDSLPCMPVTNLTVFATSYQGVTLSWTAGSSETAWEVKVYNTVDTHTYNATSNTFFADGLTSGVTYNADVRPLCGANHNIEGDWTGAPVSFTTDICHPVTGVTVGNVTGTTAAVSWTASTEGSGNYRLEYGYAGFNQGQGTTVTANTNSYTIEGLETQTMYDVYVANICTESLASTWSTKVTFETTNGGGSGEGIADVDAEGNLTLYPNPASTTVTLTVAEQFADAEIAIVDLNGRTVLISHVSHLTSTIDISTLTPGAYFVRLTGEQATVVRKLIVK